MCIRETHARNPGGGRRQPERHIAASSNSPASQQLVLTVTVPAGVLPGQVIQIQAPDGRIVNVTVPPQCGPGSSFQVQV